MSRRRRTRERGRRASVEYRKGLPGEINRSIPSDNDGCDPKPEPQISNEIPATPAEDWERVEQAREAARRAERRRVATFDDRIRPGEVRRWRETGGLPPEIAAWREWYRHEHRGSLEEHAIGGLSPLSVDASYRRAQDGRLVSLHSGPILNPVPAAALTIEDVPVAVQTDHVIAGDASFFIYTDEARDDPMNGLCHVCREPVEDHPRDLAWKDVWWWDLPEGIPTPKRRWIHAPWYSLEHAAQTLGWPVATLVNECGARGVGHVLGGGRNKGCLGYITAAGLWAMLEAQGAGILREAQSPPSKKRVKTRRPQRRPVAPGHIYGRVDGAGGLRVLRLDAERSTAKRKRWLCLCLWCGAETSVRDDKVKDGTVKSCGCYRERLAKERNDQIAMTRAKQRQRRDKTLPLPRSHERD